MKPVQELSSYIVCQKQQRGHAKPIPSYEESAVPSYVNLEVEAMKKTSQPEKSVCGTI